LAQSASSAGFGTGHEKHQCGSPVPSTSMAVMLNPIWQSVHLLMLAKISHLLCRRWACQPQTHAGEENNGITFKTICF